jgi:hypothetical protein
MYGMLAWYFFQGFSVLWLIFLYYDYDDDDYYYYFYFSHGVRPSTLGAAVTIWCIAPASHGK